MAEDEKVSLDELQEKCADFEDYIQSTDIAAMQSTCHSSFGNTSY
jgi:elongation factor 1-beta